MAVTSPRVWPCPGIPSGGFISRTRISRLKLLPDRPASCEPLGAPMEGLIELVAASFARHGIESPVDPQFVWGQPPPAVQAERSSAVAGGQGNSGSAAAQAIRLAEPIALLEHNYRKGSPEICP